MSELVFGSRYRATEKIGSGGMADVYKAVDEVLGRTVAVKVMHPRYASDPNFTQRFRQEAQAAANLVSPNIVNMYDWGQDTDTYYIVMEYVRGTDLKSIIEQKGALPSRTVAEIGAQVCSALTAAHGYDIIHRDIKPHNIMVQPDGTVKVMDFGIARAGNSTMTQTGSVLGTAHYVSPEQAQGRPLNSASDLYSLGVVLYEAATGNVPFDADTPVAVALKQVNETATRPSALNPDIDRSLESIIVRAMAKSTDDRYTTAEEMRRDLLRVIQGEPVGPAAGFAGAAAAAGYVAGAAGSADHTAVMSPVGASGAAVARTAQRKKKPVWPWIAVTAALILAGLGVAWYMGLLGNAVKPVPDVRTLDRAAATVALEEAGFIVGNVKQEFSDEVEKDKIISQSPGAGTPAKKDTPIDLVISKGPDLVVVPDIRKMPQAAADAALEAAGLDSRVASSTFDPKVTAGSVISQEPADGEQVTRGTVVNYVLSLGTEQAVVPDVEGLTKSSATSKLKAAGFKVSVTSSSSSSVKEGRVISQDKSAGGSYPKGSTVTIDVSTGKPLVTVPNVLDMSPDAAQTKLTDAGLAVEFTYNNVTATGLVKGQLPAAGKKVAPGTKITLEVDGDDPNVP
ncbi:MAG: Stk1 family PASTA domain-containing Ser/Thr kinase [Coriobacteriia bacterium]|nr:Stk1 family PASTA domain-containing Ser/Thr kinase [Coriobacteriia bacterium]